MTDELQIEDNFDLVRESASTAIINSNVNAFKLAKEARKRRLTERERIDVLEDKVDRILELLENRR